MLDCFFIYSVVPHSVQTPPTILCPVAGIVSVITSPQEQDLLFEPGVVQVASLVTFQEP